MSQLSRRQPSQINRENALRAHDKNEDFFKFVNEAAVKAGEVAVRTALIINGAAAIALLTFIGTLPPQQKRLVAETLTSFAYGVAAAAVALACAYFTNYFMAGVAKSKQKSWNAPYLVDGPWTWFTEASTFCFMRQPFF